MYTMNLPSEIEGRPSQTRLRNKQIMRAIQIFLNLTGLRIEVGAGSTTVDLSSALDHDLNATISGGGGELSVKLPGEMGMRVSVDIEIGGLTNSGLVKDGDVYVNEVYGSSSPTLFLDIATGIGSINLLAP